MKERKIPAMVLLVVSLALIMSLSACSKKEGGASSNKTITFYYWDENQKPGMDAVVESYTKATGVKVETTIIPWSQYWTKLQTALPTENGPDVFWLNLAHATDYYPANLVEPISSYVTRDNVDLSPFPKSLIEMYSYDGKLYGLPKDYDTIAMFYNKAIFDAKGVPYPTNNWTWEDLRRAAIALTDANTYGFVAEPSGQTMIFSWVLSNNGTLISPDRRQIHFNTPETIQALEWLINLINVDKAAPSGASLREMSGDDYFQSGKAAMVTTGSWMVPPFSEALGDKLGVVRLPVSSATGKAANVIHGLSFNISAKSPNKEEAWGLVKAFATYDAGVAQAKVVSPAFAGSDSAWKANVPGLDLQAFIDAASYAELVPATRVAAAAQDDIMVTQFENMWIGGLVPATACVNIDRECAAAVEAAGK
jgi:multiple sugar transport system substrate-binding protein